MTRPTVAVLTALSLEYTAVRGHLSDVRKREHPRGTRAAVGVLAGTPWSVALVQMGEGNLTAAALTERVMTWLEPQAVFFVGVAGGLKSDIALGDVVVATKVYAVHGGKDTDEGFHVRPEAWRASHRLRAAAQEALRDDPRAHLKPIAAGDVVLAASSSALAEHLRKYYNDAVAIEMEGAGVVSAVDLAGGDALVIRGISDRADGDKSLMDEEGWQARAAASAASAMVAVLRELRPFGGRSSSAGSAGADDSDEGPHRGSVYGGDHFDFRNSTFNGPFVGKRVERGDGDR
ncbi:5'-methylthioadenosine/S-adenosylhomocysteine nucleosidase [Streptomyces sp. NBC_00140]|uniref:5'-methylthioadenosine/S-adenosylhomocysteine nucleosidase n=1 Tax=Streptomyces sp. NBC_00140 TaxID=2975664 RepID=UPI0022502213|nr:5'-methylthioadenosine/S-adenosylhomocysteine nucleosidase [Streptomyces sp. NBC_00140]MCX5331268.1 5'-methylthioadenosine/S-adenosylhomocysteine nucleosidase [Streptomyces sp. NBC_00140]